MLKNAAIKNYFVFWLIGGYYVWIRMISVTCFCRSAYTPLAVRFRGKTAKNCLFLMWIKLYEIIGNHLVVASPHEIRLGLIKFIICSCSDVNRKLTLSWMCPISRVMFDSAWSLRQKGLKTISVPSYSTRKNILTTFPTYIKTIPHRCSESGPKRPW